MQQQWHCKTCLHASSKPFLNFAEDTQRCMCKRPTSAIAETKVQHNLQAQLQQQAKLIQRLQDAAKERERLGYPSTAMRIWTPRLQAIGQELPHAQCICGAAAGVLVKALLEEQQDIQLSIRSLQPRGQQMRTVARHIGTCERDLQKAAPLAERKMQETELAALAPLAPPATFEVPRAPQRAAGVGARGLEAVLQRLGVVMPDGSTVAAHDQLPPAAAQAVQPPLEAGRVEAAAPLAAQRAEGLFSDAGQMRQRLPQAGAVAPEGTLQVQREFQRMRAVAFCSGPPSQAVPSGAGIARASRLGIGQAAEVEERTVPDEVLLLLAARERPAELPGSAGRRLSLVGGGASAAALAASALPGLGGRAWAEDLVLARRFAGQELDKLSVWGLPFGRPEDLFYPPWMEGTWHVTAKLTNYSAPLGLKYVVNGGSDTRMAKQALDDQRRRVGVPVEYDLRYFQRRRGGVVEDRLFNLRAREDAYAGKPVTKRVEYTDIPGSKREESLRRGDGPDDPLMAALLYSKLGVQKIIVVRFQSEDEGSSLWRGSQSVRTLLGQGRLNPLAVDEEVLTEYRLLPGGGVAGRVRLLGFLNPNDPLFFEAGNKAVTLADYQLDLVRTSAGPGGAEAPPPGA
ncbi:unnamed protein product [Prorocentrum cordatum]|uniref:DUF6816 domain-containing protein n=1 Tax=Prorocentrum cordatum TaxID=2364126 RepID=A0ABN9QZ66_9DINO|nr:unnamed protein product [Polarella glacialis]